MAVFTRRALEVNSAAGLEIPMLHTEKTARVTGLPAVVILGICVGAVFISVIITFCIGKFLEHRADKMHRARSWPKPVYAAAVPDHRRRNSPYPSRSLSDIIRAFRDVESALDSIPAPTTPLLGWNVPQTPICTIPRTPVLGYSAMNTMPSPLSLPPQAHVASSKSSWTSSWSSAASYLSSFDWKSIDWNRASTSHNSSLNAWSPTQTHSRSIGSMYGTMSMNAQSPYGSMYAVGNGSQDSLATTWSHIPSYYGYFTNNEESIIGRASVRSASTENNEPNSSAESAYDADDDSPRITSLKRAKALNILEGVSSPEVALAESANRESIGSMLQNQLRKKFKIVTGRKDVTHPKSKRSSLMDAVLGVTIVEQESDLEFGTV